jgi:hypothetical protein
MENSSARYQHATKYQGYRDRKNSHRLQKRAKDLNLHEEYRDGSSRTRLMFLRMVKFINY